MEFKEFVNLVYIKGYFKTKPEFVIKMLKSSVQNPNLVAVTDSALKGYIYGDPIHSLAQTMIEAGLSAEKIPAFIEGLYSTEHKRTSTYKELHHGQTYKKALYDKVNEKYPEVTMDEMDEFLAKQFIEIIQKADAKPDKRCQSFATVSVTASGKAPANAPIANPHTASLINVIDDTLTELITVGHRIAEISKTDMFGLDMAGDAERGTRKRLKAKLKEKLSRLNNLALSLLRCGNHQNNSCFTEIFTLIQSLEAKDFICSEFEFRFVSSTNLDVHRLRDILSEL